MCIRDRIRTLQIDTGCTGGSLAGAAGGRGWNARIRRIELTQLTVDQADPALEGQVADLVIRLRLEPVDLRGTRHIQFQAKRRKQRVSDRDLEVLVAVVEGVD